MNILRQYRRCIAAVSCLAMLAPGVGHCADMARSPGTAGLSLAVTDVRLHHNHILTGQLVDRQGQPTVGADVALWRQGRLITRIRTDADGKFRFTEVGGGVYQVVAGQTGGIFRAWTPASSPPSAQSSILLVTGEAVRGQQGDFMPPPDPMYPADQDGLGTGVFDGAIMRTLSNPWVVGGLCAAGIAIPLALSDRGDGS